VNFANSCRLTIERGQAPPRHQPLPVRPRSTAQETKMAKIANRVFEIETASTLAIVLLSAWALIAA
jgi:hypothetical protein